MRDEILEIIPADVKAPGGPNGPNVEPAASPLPPLPKLVPERSGDYRSDVEAELANKLLATCRAIGGDEQALMDTLATEAGIKAEPADQRSPALKAFDKEHGPFVGAGSASDYPDLTKSLPYDADPAERATTQSGLATAFTLLGVSPLFAPSLAEMGARSPKISEEELEKQVTGAGLDFPALRKSAGEAMQFLKATDPKAFEVLDRCRVVESPTSFALLARSWELSKQRRAVASKWR